MKASKFILIGSLACAIAPLSGCTVWRPAIPVPDVRAILPTRTVYVDVRTPEEKAAACVAEMEPKGKAPQVMTYDSDTRTETHLNTKGREVSVTAQNATDNTSMGMEGKLGERRPDVCTSNDGLPRRDDRRDDRKNSYNGYR